MVLNLFKPQVERKLWHPYFERILSQANGYNCDVLNDWASGFIDRDNKFVREFQTTFNSSYWELFLFAVLKYFGLAVDFSKSSPDFFVPEIPFNIEATIASYALGGKPEHSQDAVEIPNNLNEFNCRAMLRLTNAINSKHRKFVDSYSQLQHVSGRPFVLAIMPVDQPLAYMQIQRPIEAVLHNYYVNEEEFRATGYSDTLAPQYVEDVEKENGAVVPLGFFESSNYREISAIIFSACAGWGKIRALSQEPDAPSIFHSFRLNMNSQFPHHITEKKTNYVESLVDGLRIYHNPYAEFPLDPEIFRHEHIFQSYMQNGNWCAEQREGQLLSRNVFSLQFVSK